jgi:hypothetical protein
MAACHTGERKPYSGYVDNVSDDKNEKLYRMERAWGGVWRIGDITGHCRHSSLPSRRQRGLSRPAPQVQESSARGIRLVDEGRQA